MRRDDFQYWGPDGLPLEQFRKRLADLKDSQFYRKAKNLSDDHKYAEQQARQNAGEGCESCGAPHGHYIDCMFFTNDTMVIHAYVSGKPYHTKLDESASKKKLKPTPKEDAWLKAQGITWEGDERYNG